MLSKKVALTREKMLDKKAFFNSYSGNCFLIVIKITVFLIVIKITVFSN